MIISRSLVYSMMSPNLISTSVTTSSSSPSVMLAPVPDELLLLLLGLGDHLNKYLTTQENPAAPAVLAILLPLTILEVRSLFLRGINKFVN